jgi:hypothetical protein
LFFLRLVYPMLPVSLDCLFVMTPSVLSTVFLIHHRSRILFYLIGFYILNEVFVCLDNRKTWYNFIELRMFYR